MGYKDEDDDPLIVLKLGPESNTRGLIDEAARTATPVALEVAGDIDADALKQVTETALDAGVELRIKGSEK